jgi:hypothetical protein
MFYMHSVQTILSYASEDDKSQSLLSLRLFTGGLSKPAAQKIPLNTVHLSQNTVHLDYMNSNQVLTGLPELAMNRANYHHDILSSWC